MKLVKVAMTLLLIVGAVQFLAASSARAQNGLSATQVQTLLVGKYACGTSGTETWDEILSGGASGTVTDYKQGPTDRIDPSKQVATYSITGEGGSAARIKYTYAGGVAPAYEVQDPSKLYPAAGIYTFVGKGGGAPTLTITVSTSPCQPHRT